MKESAQILMIGPLPPPYGGISIHIERISKLLEDDFEISYVDESKSIKNNIFNIRSLNLFRYLNRIEHADVIYIHSGSHILRLFHLFIAKIFFKKIILTIHAYPMKKNYLARIIDNFVYGFAKTIVIVNVDILKRISLPRNKCIIKHAFIPPFMEAEPDLPSNVRNWIEKRKKSGRIIVCVNAWQLDIYNNQDLYGLDMCIKVANNLIENDFQISFVFNVSSILRNKNLYDHYCNIISELNLGENFLLINEKLSFVKLIEKSDIVLRPTNTDGDALTVREALYLGKPIIASDIVKRPSGTILFKSRDSNDLELKIREIIKDGIYTSICPDQFINTYSFFYKELIKTTLL